MSRIMDIGTGSAFGRLGIDPAVAIPHDRALNFFRADHDAHRPGPVPSCRENTRVK